MLKPNISLALLVLIPIAVCVMSLALGAGCKEKKPPADTPKEPPAATAPKEVPKPEAPFPGVVAKTLGGVADATKGDLSEFSLGKLGKLHISGLTLLLLAIAAKFLFGSWRHSLVVLALGLGLSAGAVLLTDHPRIVFLIPLCGITLLIGECVWKVVRWRRKSAGFDAVTTVIETKDTGPQSTGQRIKNDIKAAGVGPIVDLALKPLEKLWKKQQESRQPDPK